jgi:hypothetical protein
VDDEDEHTVMRPATAPLPRDAFRDDSASTSEPQTSDAEPSVGLPLELPVQAPSSRKSRPNFVWLVLAAAALGGGALVLILQRQSPTLADSAAASAPKSFTRTLPAPLPGRQRDEGTLDPPISTSFEANEAVPEEEVVNTPTGVRRRPRPAIARPAPGDRPAAPVAAAQAAQPDAPERPSETAPAASDTLPEPARGAAAEPAPNAATPAPSAVAPTPSAVPAAPAAAPAAGGAAAKAPASELPQGNVDTENPYED